MSLCRRAGAALALLVALVPVVGAVDAGSAAATVPTGFTDVKVIGALDHPTDIASLTGGRLLVTGQAGVVTLVRPDGTSNQVANFGSRICTNNERGLLGIDADPAFDANGFVYIYYSSNVNGCAAKVGNTPSPAINRVSRFTVATAVLDFASELRLLDNIASPTGFHNGGAVKIGKDHYLYVSTGDGGLGGSEAQDTTNVNGKILRVGLDGSVPPSNPFTGSNTARCNVTGSTSSGSCREVVAYGLRNPFRIALDQNATSTRIFVNDVGQDTAEEIDELTIGANYGWPTREGRCEQGGRSDCDATVVGFTNPLADYTHDTGCTSIVGGAFVTKGSWGGAYDGGYLAADSVCGKISLFSPSGASLQQTTFADGLGGLTALSMVNDAGGSALYYVTFAGGGELHRITLDSGPSVSKPGAFTPLTPTRVLDTREGVGYAGGKVAAGRTITVQITGAAAAVPAGAVAVAVNLTGTAPSAPGFVTMWPTLEGRPDASNLNFTAAGETVANAALVRLSPGGQLNLYSQSNADLVLDVTGYWVEASEARAGRFVPAPQPARLLDTREGNGAPRTIVAAGGQVDLQVTGRGGVPASGVSAVAMVVTVTDSVRAGYVTVWPTGMSKPTASSLNAIGTGDIRSNLVIVPVGTGGKVSLFVQNQTHLVADITGWFTDGSAVVATSGLFVAATPLRILDTRKPGEVSGRLAADGDVTVKHTAIVGANAIAIVHNVTVDATGGAGYLTAYPSAAGRPLASNVNWSGARQTRASMTISNLVNDQQVTYHTKTATDLILDRSGWFTA